MSKNHSLKEIWIVNVGSKGRQSAILTTETSMQMWFLLNPSSRQTIFFTPVELWTTFCRRPDWLIDSRTDKVKVVRGLLRVKTTASVYTPQLPQTCIYLYARQWEIPASGKCASVYFNSRTWCFGKCLQSMVGLQLYIDSSFHKLQLHGAARTELGERLNRQT